MKQSAKYLAFIIIFYNCFIVESYCYGQTNTVDTINHFYSVIDKIQFDTLSGSDFNWVIFKQINDTISYTRFDKRPAFIQSLSTKQKVLFYTSELDGAVMTGLGFANFYYNYKFNFSETIKALSRLNDTAMLKIVNGVNKIYLDNYKQIKQEYKNGKWENIERLFAFFDNAYLKKRDDTIRLLENYIRLYKGDFVKFK